MVSDGTWKQGVGRFNRKQKNQMKQDNWGENG